MAVTFDGDEIIFSSGRRISCNCGIVGITPNPEQERAYGNEAYISEGYDGTIEVRDEYEFEGGGWHTLLKGEDAGELADAMIARWQAFKAEWGVK